MRRLNEQRHQGAGLGTYLREYLSFLVRSGWAAVKLHRRHRFGLVQVHSLPDFLVFAALPLRLVGVPVLLDLHEAMPEFFVTRFPRSANPLSHRLLLLQERLSIAFATHVLTVNEAFGDRLLGLGLAPNKLSIVINSPSLERFDEAAHPRRAFCEDGALRLIYTGALTPTYELDVTIRAVARVAAERPDLDVRFDLYGRGDSEDELRALAAELGIAERVTFHGRIPIDDVPAAVAAADIGLAPTRLDRFTAMTISGKVYEYGAMGKPVVASRLPLVERSFPEGTVAAYEPGDTGRDGRGDPCPRRRSARPGGCDRADAGRGPRCGLGARGGALRGDRGATRPGVARQLTCSRRRCADHAHKRRTRAVIDASMPPWPAPGTPCLPFGAPGAPRPRDRASANSKGDAKPLICAWSARGPCVGHEDLTTARAGPPRRPRTPVAPASRPCAAPSAPRGRGRPPPARPR